MKKTHFCIFIAIILSAIILTAGCTNTINLTEQPRNNTQTPDNNISIKKETMNIEVIFQNSTLEGTV
ncbi:MAG: hypothetical protein KAR87_03630, partial [Candidatus Aenigmarchaeota archaeon]|nr:hypothetical protein [Candidatus Aenigmarchaeota archaeon]